MYKINFIGGSSSSSESKTVTVITNKHSKPRVVHVKHFKEVPYIVGIHNSIIVLSKRFNNESFSITQFTQKAGKDNRRCNKTAKVFFYVIPEITALSKIMNLSCNPLTFGANRLKLSCVDGNLFSEKYCNCYCKT